MLSDLPPEIVSEIVSHLPYKDILVLRQVFICGDFRDATNAHAVWLNLAKQYLAENPHSHFSNIQTLSSLTTDQLCERFEKRFMVNDLWQLSKEIYPSVKRLKGLSSPMLSISIAPGGRYLFAGTNKCSLYYWDLDSDNSEPVLLVPCDGMGNIPGRNNTIAEIDFLIEHDDPLSGFIVVFIGMDGNICKKSAEWLHIWNVIPQDDGALIAKRLKSLPMPYYGFYPKLSFNDHLVARTMNERVDVYWWRECIDTRLVRCTLGFKRSILVSNLYVVGSDKLLVFTRFADKYKARLYALESGYSEVEELAKVVSHATKIWSFRFSSEYHSRGISRLYFDGANYQQIIVMHGGICNLTIPALQADKATLTKVADFDLHQERAHSQIYGLGFNKGYCRVGKELCRFGYSLGLTSGSYKCGAPVDRRLDRVLQTVESHPTFDEELGRLVTTYMNHLVLHDFSLPLYNLADVNPDLNETKDKDTWNYWKPSVYKR
ncbi:hypothetical protein AGABI1DRAFT_132773 [Agaricus bisporus var. burnettii JB137-S8]|uniref:F-box domain-containing protein n=1 Tax=Agaricus bisporus var. burnettii (strain JB137-S8 / ATCC MYA-4627 / FGSC 10392) TaxID=597362 RepID=K5WVP8_AGABU|nr:uncharacterized protein AGABI1DRAFT_132773 [Agaricus bisporus var. burnettii JB137-S8]EKM74863.1 hypothetical protein AGABI1DRAFT_132773 [Agaricus bisporus var. burnettii JB137-S8]